MFIACAPTGLCCCVCVSEMTLSSIRTVCSRQVGGFVMMVITLGASTCYCSFLMISFGWAAWGFFVRVIEVESLVRFPARFSLTLGEEKMPKLSLVHNAVKPIFFKVFPWRKDAKFLAVTFGSVWCKRAELLFQVAWEHHLRMILPLELPCIINS